MGFGRARAYINVQRRGASVACTDDLTRTHSLVILLPPRTDGRTRVLPRKVVLKGRTDLTFPYIPSHLYYCVFELLKVIYRAHVIHIGRQEA